MRRSDKDLGMNCPITRRDVVHGVSAIAVGVALPGPLFADQTGTSAIPYPPALNGMRGNHDGAFDVGHQIGLEERAHWGQIQEPDVDIYDLIVVGGGISGLSAAHFYRKENPNARILILDNHDDFGGHARRNEFQVGGRTLIGYGGSQTLVDPSGSSGIVKGLLQDLGVDMNRFDTAYDQDFFKQNGLRGGLYFNKEQWGVNRTVALPLGLYENYIPVAPSNLTPEQAVAELPISDAAKTEFLRILTTDTDQIPEIIGDEKWAYLSGISYRDFLSKHLGITEPNVFAVLQDLAADSGVGIDAVPALEAIAYSGLPGWEASGLPDYDEIIDPYIHHFPDGNASIARLLVRSMIPEVAPGTTMVDIVTARFDYSQLDQIDAPVRLRLNSTAMRVEHDGDPQSAKRVSVTYVRDGQAFRVQARGCVLACNNSIIPHICPNLPEAQREALAYQEKTPILYTNVALRNWQPWKKMGIGSVYAPGSYHIHATLDFPVSLGDYTYTGGPDEPVVVHMERFPHANYQGLTNREQFRLGRYELLGTTFEIIERNIRSQLAGMLGEAGFDPATDITGITVNRWAHGYAFMYNSLFDATYEEDDDARYPHIRARKPLGRITIANADSGALAMLQVAVEQGHRAVTELLSL